MVKSELELTGDQPGALPLLGAGVIKVQSLFGPLLAFENDLITDQIIAFGAHTRNEVALLQSFISPGDFIYDVGAHIGTFAIPLALAAGSTGLVIAIEADAKHFELLWQNLERRRLADKRTVIQAAIADEVSRYSVVSQEGNSGASYLVADSHGEISNVWRLDDLHSHLKHDRHVSVIKTDVEGMELSVLKSASCLIEKDHPILYIEIAQTLLARHQASSEEIEKFLNSRGYINFFRNTGDRNSSHDGFQLKAIQHLSAGGQFFDLVAIHENDPRLGIAKSLAGL